MHIEDSTCAVFNSINVRGSLADRSIHIFIAILAAFSNQIPKNKIETIFSIKVALDKLTTNRNQIQAHWGPGHKDIAGNELVDKQAKAAAMAMVAAYNSIPVATDKKEVISEMSLVTKICLLGFRPGKTQTGLLSYRD